MAPDGEPAAGEPAEDPMAAEIGTAGAGKKGGYVPPAMRAGGASTGEKMGGKYERDDLATLRTLQTCFRLRLSCLRISMLTSFQVSQTSANG